MYLEHLKFCVVCIYGRRYVCCRECNVVSNECNKPTSCLVQPIGTHDGKVMYFGCVCFRGELGFLNCDDICMCVMNKQFELLELVFDSVYVDLQYDEIFLTFTSGSVSLCCVVLVVMWSSLVCCLLLLSTHTSMLVWRCPSILGFKCPDCFIWNCGYIVYPSMMIGPFRDNCLRYYYI